MKKTFIITLFCLLTASVFAQQMIVHAPSSIVTGQRFTVRFEVNDKAGNFQPPTFKGLSVLSGPSQGSSSSVSIINGKMTSSTSTTFTYLIVADVPGDITVGAASCTVDGKKVSCQPFTIHVEKGDPQQQRQQSNGGYGGYSHGGQSQQQEQPTQIDAKSLFARASLSKSNPYLGEQIIITYKIYTQIPISQFQIDKLPGNKGFWAEDLSEGHDIKQYEETIDGRRYQVAEIRKGALFAQETGTQAITALDLDVLAMVQRQRRRTGTIWDLFDDPFFNSAQAVEKHLRTSPLSVQVKPLPDAPEGFYGAVGHFDVNNSVDTREVRANEAITYRLTISGSGNLMLINNPDFAFPQAFEVYDPQVTDKITRGNGGVSGSRTFEWILIPRSQGDYEIPAFQFAYFDPTAGRYVSKTLDAIPIHVEKGDPNAMKNVSSKADVQLLNSDINHIKTNGLHLEAMNESDTASPLFWALVGLIIVASGATIVWGRKHQKDAEDIIGMRNKRATREARKRLKKAAAHLKDGEDNLFYEEIYKAIWGCLADKFNIPLSTLSSDTVRDCLAEKKIDEGIQQRILQTLTDVDFARFAPGDAATKKQQIYDEALAMIAEV